MGLLGGGVAYRLLSRLAPNGKGLVKMDGSAYIGRSKLRTLLGDELVRRLEGQDVVDFGCGAGEDTVELALSGVRSVVGVDIQDRMLVAARARAAQAGVADRVRFVKNFGGRVNTVVSIDAFEHFDDPAAILEIIREMLEPGGELLISFGPTWFHPLGGHLFSPFPWAHLVFTERALTRWRRDFKSDGATHFSEVEGGLNQMTIRKFRRIVDASRFQPAQIETVPIRALRSLHNRLTEEFTTAIVRSRLIAV